MDWPIVLDRSRTVKVERLWTAKGSLKLLRRVNGLADWRDNTYTMTGDPEDY